MTITAQHQDISAAQAPSSTGISSAGQAASDKRNRILKKLGMENDWEALLCAPKRHLDCTNVMPTCDGESDEINAFRLTFTGAIKTYNDRGEAQDGFEWWMKPKRVNLEFWDARRQSVWITLFGDYNAWVKMQPGSQIAVLGSTRRFGHKLHIQKPVPIPENYIGKIWPQYVGIPGSISKASVETLVEHALAHENAFNLCAQKIIESAGGLSEQEILEYAGAQDAFDSLQQLLSELHQPQSIEAGQLAIAGATRIGALSIKSAALKACARQPGENTAIAITTEQLAAIAATQPERLSPEQLACIKGISAAIGKPTPMVGLLSGDVGTGKTLTFLVPVIAAHSLGNKCAIIAPTQILADQIANQISSRFSGLGIEVERVKTGGKINNQQAILVGTHGMSTVAKKAKYTPNLLVVDEQHKMGVTAREAMLGAQTHLLEVSATPIPRTLASAVYGGFEVFTLETCPVEKKINSYIIDVGQRPSATALIRQSLDRGERAAIIYPIVSADDPETGEDIDDEEDDLPKPKKADVQTVLKAAETLNRHFPGKVCVIHGGMSDEEKRAAIESIRSNERPLVVGSTIMETGIDIPSISAMIIRDADRFGASQLHQLRGRLVRNGGEGHFVMMVNSLDSIPETTLTRLDTVAETTNGFKLSEQDMIQRGFGSIKDQSQSGTTQAVFRLLRLTAKDFMEIEEADRQEMRRSISERISC